MKKPIKPKPAKKPSIWTDLYNRLQADNKTTRRQALSELQAKFRASDENALAFMLMRRTSCEIKTYQHNADLEAVYLINMSFEDRSKPPVLGYQYDRKYVIKNWNSLIDGVILSYLLLCKQHGRFI